MLEILFGWRKASRCKKLIRRVQCRLKLLKNKRCSMVRHLRDDVAQLLKHGHEQTAFDRVEQIFMDESIVAVYDLLDHFCEFVIIHLSYIRKHKDCPNDVNEAVSTLIFASARCGDLPELREIRELFGERYGQRFVIVALELLPGNLVNSQIKENLSTKSVPNDVKFRLLDEIARTCLRTGPLALEYYPELQEEQIIKKSGGEQAIKSDVQSEYNMEQEPQLQAFDMMEEEGKIVYVDFSSERKEHQAEPCFSYQESNVTRDISTRSSTVTSSPNMEGNKAKLKLMWQTNYESSSECSSQWPKELVYLDDIEEYKSLTSLSNVNCQDQRLFRFISSANAKAGRCEDELLCNVNKSSSRSSRKINKASGKRQRRRSVSRDSTSVRDVESTIYYGERDENSRRSHHPRKHQKKIPVDEIQRTYSAQSRLDQSFNSKTGSNFRSGECKHVSKLASVHDTGSNTGIVHECSLVKPCYFCTNDETDDCENQPRKVTTMEGFSAHNLKEEKMESRIRNPQSLRSCSRVNNPCTGKETRAPYLRTMTMPSGRQSDCGSENMARSNSFPFQQPNHLSINGLPTCGHVHPKLPDYDQLAATFKALKKANSQCKSNRLHQ